MPVPPVSATLRRAMTGCHWFMAWSATCSFSRVDWEDGALAEGMSLRALVSPETACCVSRLLCRRFLECLRGADGNVLRPFLPRWLERWQCLAFASDGRRPMFEMHSSFSRVSSARAAQSLSVLAEPAGPGLRLHLPAGAGLKPKRPRPRQRPHQPPCPRSRSPARPNASASNWPSLRALPAIPASPTRKCRPAWTASLPSRCRSAATTPWWTPSRAPWA